MTFICIHAAMLKKPVVTEVRTPTNTWSGLGFSKSMPAETIKELRRANHVSYKPSMSTTYEVPTEQRRDAVVQRRLSSRLPSLFLLSGFSPVLVPIRQPRRHRKRQRLRQLERAERPVRSRRVPLHRRQPEEETKQIRSVRERLC